MASREEILKRAGECVNGDRHEDYGTPEHNFETIAGLWNVYLDGRPLASAPIGARDVAAMMSLMKIARIASGKAKSDNWVDLAGYAACGGEIDVPTPNDSDI